MTDLDDQTPADLGVITTRGVMWTGASRVFEQLFQIATLVVLARLLLPADFGVLAVAAFVTGLIGRVMLGLRFPIIQMKSIDQTTLATLFWTSMALGLVLWGLTSAVAPFASLLIDSDVIGAVLIVLALEFVIGSFGVVPSAILNRKLRFKALAVANLGSTLAASVVSIGLAIAGYGVWSLVWGGLTGSFVMVVITWSLERYIPRFRFSFRSLVLVWRFGSAVVGNSAVNFIGTDIDRLLVGRYLGATSVGLFSQASRLSQLPRTNLARIVSQVTFPTFSRIQDDDERMRVGYLKSTAYLSMITFPLLGGLAVTAPEFVGVAYGEKWAPMVLPLQLLCLGGASASIGTLVGTIGFSKARADLLLKTNLVKMPIFIVLVIVVARYGLVELALASSVFITLWVAINQVIFGRLIGVEFISWVKSWMPATLATGTMVVTVLAGKALVRQFVNLDDGSMLALSIALGIVSYGLVLILAWPSKLREMRNLVTAAIRTPTT